MGLSITIVNAYIPQLLTVVVAISNSHSHVLLITGLNMPFSFRLLSASRAIQYHLIVKCMFLCVYTVHTLGQLGLPSSGISFVLLTLL